MRQGPRQSVLRDLRYLERNRPRNVQPPLDAAQDWAMLIDRQAARRPHATAIIDEQGEIDWAGLRDLSNRVANLVLAQGVQKSESVALNMENSILFLACVIGITRAGAVAGLINTNLRGGQLVHCIRAIDARVSLVGGAALAAIAEAGENYLAVVGDATRVIHFAREGTAPERLGKPNWLLDGEALLAAASPKPPVLADPVRVRDRALYIFTSGTTGLPKPAVITQRRLLHGSSSMALFAFRARPQDRLYNCLPLYHGTGLMVGAAACFYSGASMVVRRRFSASQLIADANAHRCNMLVYVGEICRYLVAIPPRPDDARCSLTRAAGNGLRPDIWRTFKRRFGLRRITEFYGAGEGNAGFMNVFDREGSIGTTSTPVRLVRYTAEDAGIVRGADGFAIPVAPGDPGLMLAEVSEAHRYDGYRDDAQSEGKLVRDAFARGDCWFNSGDVLRVIDVGDVFGMPHYQFVDRLGDTFRWKSENVATNEVGEVLCAAPGVALACVYGVAVPGADGKAGMVALLPVEGGTIDLEAFARHAEAHLPRYARPLFVRIVEDMAMTGTHKFVRTQLVEEAYDAERIADPLYCWDAATARYVPLDADRLAAIRAGRSGY